MEKRKTVLISIVVLIVLLIVISAFLIILKKDNQSASSEIPCELEGLHGINLSCGSYFSGDSLNDPLGYQIGDECRGLAYCSHCAQIKETNGQDICIERECRLAELPPFESCKNCAETCVGDSNCFKSCFKNIDFISLCNQIENTKEKNKCILMSAQSIGSTILCDSLPDSVNYTLTNISVSYSKQKCYHQLALKLKNVSLCDNTENPYQIALCYVQISGKTPNPDICEKTDYIPARDGCYSIFADNLKDETYCEKIVGGDSKDLCYSYIALVKKDVKFCDKIVNGPYAKSRKDDCYRGLK